MRWFWPSWRLQRFEVLASTAIVVAIAIAIAVLSWQLLSFSSDPQCLGAFTGEGNPDDLERCPGLIAYLNLQSTWVRYVFVALTVAPLIVGVLLGAPLVAREIDQRTAELTWAVSASRSRWVLGRAAAILIMLAVLCASLAIASDFLEGARTPLLDAGNSFLDYGSRSWVLVGRGVAVAAIALFVGAFVGRVLPAVVVSLAVGGAVLVLAPFLAFATAPTQALPAGQQVAAPTDYYAAVAWRTEDGELLSDAEARAMAPAGDAAETASWLEAEFDYVTVVVPGKEFMSVQAREIVVEFVVATLALAATVAIVRRRAPY